jgi:pyruvate/2-oxoglutarate dehydrogenase complex dihydrolipoamide dehydrogenase (E3) component
VVQNALFFGRARMSALTIPWCTYTSPEVAHVGISERTAARDGVAIDTFRVPLAEVDRAILEGETEGFVKVHVAPRKDRILGATVVARDAGDLIGELTLAMRNGIGLKKIGATIHPYPTQAEAIRKLGDAFNRGRLTPAIAKALATWFAWTR